MAKHHDDQWTTMGSFTDAQGRKVTVLEDFTRTDGAMKFKCDGQEVVYPKHLEATFVDPAKLYFGRTFAEIRASPTDLMGQHVLGLAGDPSFEALADAVVPITKNLTYTFVATPDNEDKVGIEYGGRTPNFDPGALDPLVRKVRADHKVLDGLVGGWLPAVRMVYLDSDGAWVEFMAFARFQKPGENHRVQPVWYRVMRVEGGKPKWVKYYDSYFPGFLKRDVSDSGRFYEDFAEFSRQWSKRLAPGIKVDIPDQRSADLAKHSVARAMMTRIKDFPKYGFMDRNYGAAEHDGFQDTLTVEVTTLLQWGLFDDAKRALVNYLEHFMDNHGGLRYRGAETGQYGRMLTVFGQYFAYTHDASTMQKYRGRTAGVVEVLRMLRTEALGLPKADPAYGMIRGWCEADSCLDPDPERYRLPYFSNTTEAVRGFRELGAAWRAMGDAEGDKLVQEADAMERDLHESIKRSTITSGGLACIPSIAGAGGAFDVACQRDGDDPQARSYRAYNEMLHSGVLTPEEVATIVAYREARHDILLGMTCSYGFNSGEVAGFLAYGHAFGLLQTDRVREFLLMFASLSAHHYTRGTWTAPETRQLDPAREAAPYCVPAQLVEPLLLRWMLLFEDPRDGALWVGKATPREWLADGRTVSLQGGPTKFGKVSFVIRSHVESGRVDVDINLPKDVSAPVYVRLRLPEPHRVLGASLAGKPVEFDAKKSALVLPKGSSGKLKITVTTESVRRG